MLSIQILAASGCIFLRRTRLYHGYVEMSTERPDRLQNSSFRPRVLSINARIHKQMTGFCSLVSCRKKIDPQAVVSDGTRCPTDFYRIKERKRKARLNDVFCRYREPQSDEDVQAWETGRDFSLFIERKRDSLSLPWRASTLCFSLWSLCFLSPFSFKC